MRKMNAANSAKRVFSNSPSLSFTAQRPWQQEYQKGLWHNRPNPLNLLARPKGFEPLAKSLEVLCPSFLLFTLFYYNLVIFIHF